MSKKIMVVFGTRPEAIKMAPVVKELKKRPDFNTVVCVTGQHRQMLDQVLEVFDIVPDIDLAIMKANQTLSDITTEILIKMKKVLKDIKPDLVLVHGDTTTTFATAVACYYEQIAIGHVEAGLRTHNIYSPYPEEFNRQAVSIISKYNFAPTEAAKENLLREGRDKNNIFVTGNTAIDALKTTVKDDYQSELLEWVGNSRLILLTAHRRENLGKMIEMFEAVAEISEKFENVKIIYPVHMNPIVRNAAQSTLNGNSRIRLIEPLDVVGFHNLMAASYLILTDSGGIQEEAPSLGKPVLVMRDTTERPEGIEAGTLKLVGTSKKTIFDSVVILLTDSDEYEKMSKANNPYGDGKASIRIADILEGIELCSE